MGKIWMLLLTLTISTLFIHVPHKGEVGFPLNPDVKLSYNQYFWFIGQILNSLVYAAIIWDEAREHKKILGCFLCITGVDALMWFLCYDDPLKHYILTWNILKTLVFLGVIIWFRTRRT
jgi:hypothetical protein